MRISWLMNLTQYIILLRVTTSKSIPSKYDNIQQFMVDKKVRNISLKNSLNFKVRY